MIINGRQVRVRAAYDASTGRWGIRERRVHRGKVVDRGLWATTHLNGWTTSLGFGDGLKFETKAEAEAWVRGYNTARREARDFSS